MTITVVIPAWLVWLLLCLVAFVALCILSPTVTRNHDGETLVFWMGRCWRRHNGRWERR